MRICHDGIDHMNESVQPKDKLTIHLKMGLILGALALLFSGIFITPGRLMKFGIMRQSLVFGAESVRKMAIFEIAVFRILCLIFAVLLIILFLNLKQVLNSRFIQHILHSNTYDYANLSNSNSIYKVSFLAIMIFILLGLLYIWFGAEIFNTDSLQKINDEDGYIENISALMFFISGIVATFIAFRSKRLLAPRIVYGILAFLFFFTVGEEISWGQRIFNLETWEIFNESNVQNENNLHNLFGYMFDHVFIAGVFIVGFAIPFITKYNRFIRRLWRHFSLPIASLGLALGFLIISLMHHYTIYKIFNEQPYLRIAELRELLTSIALFLLMIESLALLKRRQSEQDKVKSKIVR